MQKPDIVIYHKDCSDGFCAAWVVRNHFNLPDSAFIGGQYGQTIPDVTGKHVLIVDFSYPRDMLIDMQFKAASLLVLDHHKTAKAALEELDFCIFREDMCGAHMAWLAVHDLTALVIHDGSKDAESMMPWPVRYVEDRDLWLHKLPNTQEISAYLRSIPFSFDAWDNLIKPGAMDTAIQCGRVILEAKDYSARAHVARAINIHLAERIVPCVNVSATDITSDVGELLCLAFPDSPFSVMWHVRGDSLVIFSLRSRGGFDVSEVAKKFGGGGCSAAAGFAMPLKEGLEMIAKNLSKM